MRSLVHLRNRRVGVLPPPPRPRVGHLTPIPATRTAAPGAPPDHRADPRGVLLATGPILLAERLEDPQGAHGVLDDDPDGGEGAVKDKVLRRQGLTARLAAGTGHLGRHGIACRGLLVTVGCVAQQPHAPRQAPGGARVAQQRGIGARPRQDASGFSTRRAKAASARVSYLHYGKRNV
jgi:hypothetical protein